MRKSFLSQTVGNARERSLRLACLLAGLALLAAAAAPALAAPGDLADDINSTFRRKMC